MSMVYVTIRTSGEFRVKTLENLVREHVYDFCNFGRFGRIKRREKREIFIVLDNYIWLLRSFFFFFSFKIERSLRNIEIFYFKECSLYEIVVLRNFTQNGICRIWRFVSKML